MRINNIKIILKRVYRWLDNVLFLFFYKTHLVSIYYFLRSDFRREMNAVAAGRVLHEKLVDDLSINYNLRRNIHRVEKGLSSIPRRDIFGLDYITQTVDLYCKIRSTDKVITNEIQWASDVLLEYFNTVTLPIHLKASKARYLKASLPNDNKIPFSKEIKKLPGINFESFLSLAEYRCSIRSFKETHVSKDLIDNAILAAMKSPSACNRHPIRFEIIQEEGLLSKCVELPMGVATFKDRIVTMVAVIGRQRAYTEVRDRHVIYVDGGLASMTFMYALEVQGVSSCPINWPDIATREHQASKILQLADDEKIIMWLAVGYAAKEALTPYSAKLELELARNWRD